MWCHISRLGRLFMGANFAPLTSRQIFPVISARHLSTFKNYILTTNKSNEASSCKAGVFMAQVVIANRNLERAEALAAAVGAGARAVSLADLGAEPRTSSSS